MFDSLCRFALLAQEQSSFSDGVFKILYLLGIVALVIVLPLVLGSFLAKSLRMRGYEWKLGVIFLTIAISSLIVFRSYSFAERKFQIPLGVDLKGGVILVYEIATDGGTLGPQAADQSGDINMGDLVQALTNRINPSGTKEIVIRPYGDRQVEIIIPEVDAEEVRNIKRQISTAGSLEFRIVGNTRDHRDIIALAEEQSQDPDPARRISKRVLRDNEPVGYWAQAAKEKLKAVELEGNILRNASTGEMLDLQSLAPMRDSRQPLDEYLAENGLENVDVLVATDDGCDVTGDNLGMVAGSVDEYLSPCVNFRLRGEGIAKFQLLTSSNLPDTDSTPPFYRHLGIILDERLISFPRLITTISDSGRITGNFTQEEVDFLVGILRAGKLPATLQKEPISENQIGSMLGDDTIQKGKTAIGISLVAVLVFVAFYYRFAGLVACAALLANLLFIFAVMILLNAPLTLPGLAGLVLTVGMSVDANVLIFERMREELQRGAGIRMAIRNGFDKATTTIVDANVTTLITAMVLYAIGTDQIRGFAVTLILGILMSMYTAIFCSRVVFDIAERRQWIVQLRMMRILGSTHVDFIGKRNMCIAGSMLVIVIGLVAIGMRGKTMFDIDFTGGTSVTMLLEDSMPPDEVRSRLDRHFSGSAPPIKCSVNTVSVDGRPSNSVYKIDANLESTDELEVSIQEAFRDSAGDSLLLSYSMTYSDVKQVALARDTAALPAEAPVAPAAPEPQTDVPADAPAAEPAGNQDADRPVDETPPAEDSTSSHSRPTPRTDLPPDSLLAMATQDEPSAPEESPSAEVPPADAAPPGGPPESAPEPVAEEPAASEPEQPAAAPPAAEEVRTVARVTFGDAINAPTLRDKIRLAYNEVHPAVQAVVTTTTDDGTEEANALIEVPGLLVDTDEIFDADQTSAAMSKEWYVRMVGTPEVTTVVLEHLKQDLANTPVLPSSSKVGGQVAGDTRALAIAALLASLLGIVAYIWIRFQHLVFGLAAVVALVHDVVITLGAIALSAYVAGLFGFLLIEEFKINLPIVAALLTIIGYSLNDTIVIFDRIREVRGKSPDLTADMINASINQTLSRTLLTSLTTLIVVVILYALGGSGIHGFAFALSVGIIVGTYSSIYIASPILLSMLARHEAAEKA